ncbi:hypothetical protein [Acidisoma silvae]|uniref:Uncharacterized protein n=1 Tax=Acidisoma silvae TaxID=2802396 RepID=A0A963YUN8_9PROT|nr:hypothetical protein [Acidisoma silvae]MCB8877417.1 hypothetical protein [Acidisoma silvae]
MKTMRPQQHAALNRQNTGKKNADKADEQTLVRRSPRASSWDPSHSWRNRRSDEKRFLTSLERRYLRDAFLSLEKSHKAFNEGFVVKPQGDRDVADTKLPPPLAKLVENGLINIEKSGNEMRCYLTNPGFAAIKYWLLTQPPNFRVMFPRLYQQLTTTSAKTKIAAKVSPK